MKKRVTVLLFFAALCAAVFAQSESDFKTDGKGTITGYTGSATSVVIPARIGGVPITAIGKMAFQFKNLTSVTIPYGVTTIGQMAFSMNRFTSITIPPSVTFIDDMAFYQAPMGDFSPPAITSITIGANVKLNNILGETFDLYYEDDYNRQAGTYTRSGKNSPWKFSPIAQQQQQQWNQQQQQQQQQWQQTQQQQQSTRIKCSTCGGSGKCKNCGGGGGCSACNGTGKVRNIKPDGDLYYNCAVCNGSGKCGWCSGTGKCQGCRGTGYL